MAAVSDEVPVPIWTVPDGVMMLPAGSVATAAVLPATATEPARRDPQLKPELLVGVPPPLEAVGVEVVGTLIDAT